MINLTPLSLISRLAASSRTIRRQPTIYFSFLSSLLIKVFHLPRFLMVLILFREVMPFIRVFHLPRVKRLSILLIDISFLEREAHLIQSSIERCPLLSFLVIPNIRRLHLPIRDMILCFSFLIASFEFISFRE